MTMLLRVMTGASIHCAIACSLNKLPYHDQPGPGKMSLRFTYRCFDRVAWCDTTP